MSLDRLKIEVLKASNRIKVTVMVPYRGQHREKIKIQTSEVMSHLKSLGHKLDQIIEHCTVSNVRKETCSGEWVFSLELEPVICCGEEKKEEKVTTPPPAADTPPFGSYADMRPPPVKLPKTVRRPTRKSTKE